MLEFNTAEEFVAHVQELLEKKQISTLRELLNAQNPTDIAMLLNELGEEQLAFTFRILAKEIAAETFIEMDLEGQEMLIKAFSDAELTAIVNDLYIDDAVDMVEEMPASVVKRILKSASADTRRQINELLKYPENSAGSMMTTEYVSLRKEMTVEQAFARIRQNGVDKETIYTCYVTKADKELLGIVSVRTLLLASAQQTVEELMETNLIFAHTKDDREDVAQRLSKYHFMAMPVVDDENRLVGIVTFDDAIDVLQEEATEDIEKMAALIPADKPYMKTGVVEIFKKRIPWLLLLMVSATLTGRIISHFEDALASAIVLTAFIPMLMDTAGNAGSQASVTIIRGISLNEIQFSDILTIIGKEARVSLLCGITLAGANFAKLMLFDKVGLTLAMVVCITLFVTVFFSKITGCLLPVLAKKAGFDPAVMASPFITTIVDAIALLVYFQVAHVLLGI